MAIMKQSYYVERVITFVSQLDDDALKAEADFWSKKTEENKKAKRADMICFSMQMEQACLIAKLIKNDPEKMDALKVKLFTLRCLEDDIKKAKDFAEKYEEIGITVDAIVARLEKEADAARYAIEKIIDI